MLWGQEGSEFPLFGPVLKNSTEQDQLIDLCLDYQDFQP